MAVFNGSSNDEFMFNGGVLFGSTIMSHTLSQIVNRCWSNFEKHPHSKWSIMNNQNGVVMNPCWIVFDAPA